MSGGPLAALHQVCRARRAHPGEGVGGVRARWVAEPADTGEVAGALRVAAAHDLGVVARGGGSKLAWGSPPERCELIVDTGRLAGVVEADEGGVRVRAGTPLVAVNEALGERWVPLDPGYPQATVGGIVATGACGPLRMAYGAPRDLIRSVTCVRADGEICRGDRLLAGSYGTLGVLTEVAFRVRPVPAARCWALRRLPGPVAAYEAAREVLDSGLAPSAVEIDLPPAGAAGTVGVLFEGDRQEMAHRRRQIRRRLGEGTSTMDRPPPWWGRYPFRPGDVALQVAVPVAELRSLLHVLRDATMDPIHIRGSAGTGVVYVAMAAGTPPENARNVIGAVRISLLARDGWCAVLDAPFDVPDRWADVPALTLMRAIKDHYDPCRRLSPGRFVGGI